jgi:hypothetical protein
MNAPRIALQFSCNDERKRKIGTIPACGGNGEPSHLLAGSAVLSQGVATRATPEQINAASRGCAHTTTPEPKAARKVTGFSVLAWL